jgi:hypothetical protein
MHSKFIEEEIKYTGSELAPHWIYKNFHIQGDAVVAFIGECDVKITEMVDIEDVIDNSPIYSQKMLNFIIEHFNMGLVEGVVRQRLFINIIREQILKHLPKGSEIVRSGDDLFFDGKKLSVSIAGKSINSVLIHTGINIISENAAIEASGLTSDMGLKNIHTLGKDIIDAYAQECDNMLLASTKVRGII